ncbi:MAG: glucose 1-dehydrogenase [Candidatus Bathyarchaeia archaeon]|nr:glucose 1-dehydrogenase [Candidatus Bathyarchaeota archaeon]
MSLKLQGKVALVTGAGRGLGRAYALRLAQIGADVVVNDINLDSAKDYNEKLSASTVMDEIKNMGRKSIGIQADVTKKDQVDGMFKQVLDEFGRLDILVNNAGGNLNRLGAKAGTPVTYPSSASMDDHQFIMDVNLTGTILCCQAASVPMKKQRYGKIVNVASQAGLHVAPEMVNAMSYSVAKAAIIHYTRYLAAELGPYNISVNCIAPGWIATSRAVAEGRKGEVAKRLEMQIPLGRLGTPEDVAKVVEFLVTDLSDYVTGQCISVCGGYILF